MARGRTDDSRARPRRNQTIANESRRWRRAVVSAEVRGGRSDVEVFVLKETGKNTGVFRGFIDTHPGLGRKLQGAVEVTPGDVVRLGYVDTANAKGRRTVIYNVILPVVAPVPRVVGRAE